jgi:hypothetical protein
MAKIDELKKQNQAISPLNLEAMFGVFSKSKYVDLFLNLLKEEDNKKDKEIEDISQELITAFHVPKEIIKNKSFFELHSIYNMFSSFGYEKLKAIKRFEELNERGLINNPDVSSYKNFEELECQLSIAEMKLVDKEMEKQVLKLMDNDEWLVLKPLTYESAKKYGASTKWCTSSEEYPNHFKKYTGRGILIYVINKLSGLKVAAFKNLNKDYDKETSFWNAIDDRIDSLESGLPASILNLIQIQLSTCTQTNYDLLSPELKEKKTLKKLHDIMRPSFQDNHMPVEIERVAPNNTNELINRLRVALDRYAEPNVEPSRDVLDQVINDVWMGNDTYENAEESMGGMQGYDLTPNEEVYETLESAINSTNNYGITSEILRDNGIL